MNSENIIKYTSDLISTIVTWLPTAFGAIVSLIVWLRIIKRIRKFVIKWFVTSKVDVTVSKFLTSLITIGLKILLIVTIAGMFGVQTTSFVALLWAAGLAVWLALQWSLANFAGWLLILLFKPYKIWDLVEIQSIKWHVAEIGILNTVITTLENNTAILPNWPIINNNILNLTTKDTIRVDVSVGVSYDTDIDHAKTILKQVINENNFAIKDKPGTWVYVNKLWDSSVELLVRAYTKPSLYRDTYFDLTEQTKKALDLAQIEIPFPQRVVHTAPANTKKV